MSNLHRPRVQRYNVRILNHLLNDRSKLDKTQLSHLLALSSNTKGLNEFHTTYNYKINKKDKDCSIAKLGYGRIYGEIGSLEYLFYMYRNNLYAKTLHDIDMKNCHPTLLCQLSKKLGYECKALQEYVDNREEYLAQLKSWYEEQGIDKTRYDLKTELISCLYGAKIDTFKNIKKDLDILTTLLQEEHSMLYDAVKKLNKPNINGAFLSFIAQTEEVKCLGAMDSFYLQKGRIVSGLAYDGLLIDKLDENEVFPTELLREAEQFVKEKTGYIITLEVKPMIQDIDDSLMQSASEKAQDSYLQMKDEFEKRHFYLEPTNAVVRVEDNGSISQFLIAHALTAFNGLLIKTDKGDKSFLKMWINDPTRRIIRRLVFKMPNECLEHEYSLFNGFDYQRITEIPTDEERQDSERLFLDLVSCICNDEKPVVDYVLNTFADMLQNPFEKTGVLIAFASPLQGTGKDTVMLIIQRIIGNHHTAHYTSTEAFWEKHDTKREGAILCYLEEACSRLNKAKSNELKARITSPDIELNPKGLKGYSVPNACRIIMTGNTITHDLEEDDRRSLLIAPSGRNKGLDWTKVYASFTPTFIRSIGEYLENRPLVSWNPRVIPETTIKTEMKELARSSEKLFLEQWDCDEFVSASTMFNAYSSYCDESSLPRAMNVLSFSKRLALLATTGTFFERKKDTHSKNWIYKSV